MEMVNIKINGASYAVPAGSNIVEAARYAGVEIPTLCYLKDINQFGSCRVCVVEVKGARTMVAACVYPVNEGMEVFTNTEKVRRARKMNLELILSNHEQKCLSCARSTNCELQRLSLEYGADPERYKGENIHYAKDTTSAYLVRDPNKCILCRRCVAACGKVQSVFAIGAKERGFRTEVGCAFDADLADVACVGCGQCIVACPVGALTERDQTEEVWAALNDPQKHVFITAAPAIRATLGECFDMPIGTNVEGKLPAALRRLGFEGVYDLDVTADLTIMEEGTELLHRVKTGGALPLITSCSPGWIKFCEHFYPEFLPNLSSCKSPQQMFGAVMKTYYAQKMGIDPKDIFYVSVIPCTAKKFEVGRENQSAAGVPDVDVAITTRELASMIKRAGIVFPELPNEEFDSPFGIASGAGAIFGVTGGVMEAALRTVAEVVEGKPLEKLEFDEVRGLEGVKEATYKVGDLTVRVAVASGLSNARKVLDAIKSGEKQYEFVEIMACPGGCINGGGQPLLPDSIRNTMDARELRKNALYTLDERKTLRKSHENPVVQTLYKEFFDEPYSEKAHKLLHTKYVARDQF